MKWIFIFYSLLFSFSLCHGHITPVDSLDTKTVVIRVINVFGNHRTKEKTITRELTFQKGDSIEYKDLDEEIDRSRSNILNTSLFNFVTIDKVVLDHEATINITLQERWYFWPYPILEIADRNLSVWLSEKNWDRINYGVHLIHHNFSGRADELVVKSRFGYEEHYNLAYGNPYINKNQTIGINLSANLFRYKEIPFATVNDEPLYYQPNEGAARTTIIPQFVLLLRPKLYNRHLLSFEMNDDRVNDSIASLNPGYYGDGRSRITYFSAGYSFVRDLRDSKIYPLDGYLLSFKVKKIGLGLYKEHVNDFNLQSSLMYFKPLSKKFYFATSMHAKWKPDKTTPYFLNSALGSDRVIAGYEDKVINGQSFVFAKNMLKFELLKPKEGTFDFIGNPRFNKFHYASYLNLNFDVGFVYDPDEQSENVLANELLFGGGIGIDFVTYYDIVLRFEFSFNKTGEFGFYPHYGSPFQ